MQSCVNFYPLVALFFPLRSVVFDLFLYELLSDAWIDRRVDFVWCHFVLYFLNICYRLYIRIFTKNDPCLFILPNLMTLQLILKTWCDFVSRGWVLLVVELGDRFQSSKSWKVEILLTALLRFWQIRIVDLRDAFDEVLKDSRCEELFAIEEVCNRHD